ncbi:hypothetical protein BN1708_000821 [Verticillium longisporum]|uniref:Adenosine kinase n=1 Tax=Verticillium longisporum TaxID=100787 RepID=A0A0G4M844_VERLO|nr:hypothetical protein BN1708_000821 [Verticillium longisporum]
MAATKEYSLLVLENPLLDIQAVGNQELLDKYKLKANDAILASEEHLSIYEDLHGSIGMVLRGWHLSRYSRGQKNS